MLRGRGLAAIATGDAELVPVSARTLRRGGVGGASRIMRSLIVRKCQEFRHDFGSFPENLVESAGSALASELQRSDYEAKPPGIRRPGQAIARRQQESMMRSFRCKPAMVAGALAAGLLLAAPAAEASPVFVRDGNGGDLFNGGPGSQTLTINVDGSNTQVKAGAFVLEYRLLASDPWTAFITYCLEPDEFVGNLSNPASFGGDLGSVLDYAGARITALTSLYANWFNDSLTNSTKSAAFQLAVWEIAYDTGTPNLGAGDFRYAGGGAVGSQAVAYLTTANPQPTDLSLAGILRVGNQDFTIVVLEVPTTPQNVPEPGTLALFGLGLAGLAAARRRRRAAGSAGRPAAAAGLQGDARGTKLTE